MDLDGLLTDTTETSFLVNMKTGIETIKNLETWLSTWKQLLTQEHRFQLGNFPINGDFVGNKTTFPNSL